MTDSPKQAQRTEEIQDIVDRMPTNFGYLVSAFVLVLFLLIVVFGFAIKYPQVVGGEITINAESSPIKLVARVSGNITEVNFKSNQIVRAGDYIAVIQNPANVRDVKLVQAAIKKIDPGNPDRALTEKLPRSVSLGELNLQYFNFLNILNQYSVFHNDNIYDKEHELLVGALDELHTQKVNFEAKLGIAAKNVDLMKRFVLRDSILYSKKVLTEAEHDRSEMNFISVRDAYLSYQKDVSMKRSEIQDTRNRMEQNRMRRTDREQQLRLELVSKYSDLEDGIKDWESKFVFKSPINGKVQYLKFLNRNQFIQNGESIIAVLPAEDKLIGQMTLPASGSGKVKPGQKVIIKLVSFPFREYGSIQGTVAAVSLTTDIRTTQTGAIDTYLVNIVLPKGLLTNFGIKLPFKYELKGTAEIITKDRVLIERLFDNLRYDTTEK